MGILSQYRVLDFGRFIAGPYCAALLAEFGADVIRIEKCNGSEDRYITPIEPGGTGSSFLQMNRNKRGLTLNPMKPEGREVLKRLVATADVVVANLPDKGLEAMGLDYASLCEIRPDIILAKMSTFGSVGPYSERIGFDGLGQAMSGAAYLSGDDEAPAKSTAPFVDFSTAMMSALGVVMALMEREKTGKGQIVEGTLLGSAMTTMSSYLVEQAITGANRPGTGNRSQVSSPSDLIRTKDGWFMTQVVGNPIFARWCKLIGKPELVDDERFNSDEARGLNGAELSQMAEDHARDMTTQEVLEAYAAANVPAGPVMTPAQVLEDPHVAAAGFLAKVDYPALEQAAPLVTAPVRLSETPGAITRPPPELGEHTDEILGALGFSPEDIGRFRAARAV